VESKINCLPVYIVIDTSGSMRPFEGVLNQSIEALYEELIMSPQVSDFAHISILSYNTEPELVLQMASLQSLTALPQLQCGGITNFGKVLRFLRELIDQDVPFLSGVGREVLRPVVFLLTDGQPTNDEGHRSEDWKRDYETLVDRKWPRHPNVVPFGYGDVSPEMLAEVCTIEGAAFIAKVGGTGDALRRVIPTLLNTLVASARDGDLRLPAEVPGFIRVSPEVVE
jgi:Mg-chelatase subunit ChlD